MSQTAVKMTILLLMLAACTGLWMENQKRMLWPLKIDTPVHVGQDNLSPTARALELAKGMSIIQQPGHAALLQTAEPITVGQFNTWLRELADEYIRPVSLTLTPAEGEGKLNLTDTGFKQ